jgi:hypothetical protein
MSIETLRDWAIIYAGALWFLGTLVLTALVAGLWLGTGFGFTYLNKNVVAKLHDLLALSQTKLAAVQDQTSRLPGNEPIDVVARAGGIASLRLPSLPFRRRKKRWFLPFRR